MNKMARWALGISAIVMMGAGLVLGGMYLGSRIGYGGYGTGMLGRYAQSGVAGNSGVGGMGPGMMSDGYGMLGGSAIMGNGMMAGGNSMTLAPARSAGVGGTGTSPLYGVQPLSISAAQNVVQTYLTGLGNSDLTVGEVIIFDNQAYARIDEKSTGHAALEVLVDPVTLAVFPEPGANMMWNLKYGMTAGANMMGTTGMGNMMGGGAATLNPADPMPVTVQQAVETAQRYLDAYAPGAQAETTADTFYGYYTLEVLRNGQTAGMLSVNGYTRQVILHTWHGRFIESSAR